MSATEFFDSPQGRRIAYHKSGSIGPTVVFLGGLKSDMSGTKAVHLESWAQARDQRFLRFDYSGHGKSSGNFEDGCIGDWHEDALAAVSVLTGGPLVLVGSSMGGWQALLLARSIPTRINGLVTIAAAPDFTEDSYWAEFSDEQKFTLKKFGRVELPSEYGEHYTITRRLIEDGRNQLVLRKPLLLDFPVRFLKGADDAVVSNETAVRLLEHVDGFDIKLMLIKGKDHRFSDEECLGAIVSNVEAIISA